MMAMTLRILEPLCGPAGLSVIARLPLEHLMELTSCTSQVRESAIPTATRSLRLMADARSAEWSVVMD
ncbi:hypothetical protein ADK67_27790 [Saccharothrix sp. NRRL B-16348]|nr:hypothetical protein ADK67_27790 [Saccharothrix sp. NRRL B-16348]